MRNPDESQLPILRVPPHCCSVSAVFRATVWRFDAFRLRVTKTPQTRARPFGDLTHSGSESSRVGRVAHLPHEVAPPVWPPALGGRFLPQLSSSLVPAVLRRDGTGSAYCRNCLCIKWLGLHALPATPLPPLCGTRPPIAFPHNDGLAIRAAPGRFSPLCGIRPSIGFPHNERIGDPCQAWLRCQAPWQGVSACLQGGYNRVWHFGR